MDGRWKNSISKKINDALLSILVWLLGKKVGISMKINRNGITR
jgi:hypothetical protein